MKIPVSTTATVGLALAATTGSASAFSNAGNTLPKQRTFSNAPTTNTGETRLAFVGSVKGGDTSLGRLEGPNATMRDYVLNTHRHYPVGRDSREHDRLLMTGVQMFVGSMMQSAEQSIMGSSVSQGTAQESSHTLEEIVHGSHKALGHDAATAHHLQHEAAQLAQNALHSHPHMDLHHDHGHSMASDVLSAMSVSASTSFVGQGALPKVAVSGALAIAALAGAAHGVQAADHLLMTKLQTFPAAYQYAAKMNEGIGSFLQHMESSGVGHSIKQGLVEMIKSSNIETAVDSGDANSLRSVKLNVKPVPGGPSLSFTLSASEKSDDSSGANVKTKRREFSVDVPGGGLTLAIPETVSEGNDALRIQGRETVPAILSFVEKSSGAELTLAQMDIPKFA